jgi:tRNA pseudouridine38-40 synthase
MVGSLIQVGCGRWSEQYFCDIFDAKDRTRAGPTASACGLYLVEIRYGLPHLHSNIV